MSKTADPLRPLIHTGYKTLQVASSDVDVKIRG